MQRVKDKIKHMCFVHEKIGKLSVPLLPWGFCSIILECGKPGKNVVAVA